MKSTSTAGNSSAHIMDCTSNKCRSAKEDSYSIQLLRCCYEPESMILWISCKTSINVRGDYQWAHMPTITDVNDLEGIIL